MSLHVGYTGAVRCTGETTFGAKSLMSWFLGAYRSQGAVNLGIYVCKDVAGSATRSVHGEGRATDLGHDPYSRPPWGKALANALVNNSRELGVQCVIHDGRIWSGVYPHEGWRPYRGSNPHVGHIHTELTWDAARSLTAARIQTILGGTTPQPVPAQDWTRRMIMAMPELRVGTEGHFVTTGQALLLARGHQVKIDGDFGAQTRSAVVAFQASRSLAQDGVIGVRTWHHLLNMQRLL